MPDPPGLSKVEQAKDSVQAVVTLMLTLGFIYLSVRGEVGSDLYSNIFSVIVAFWFGSRGQTDAAKIAAATNGTPKTTMTAPAEATVTATVKPPEAH